MIEELHIKRLKPDSRFRYCDIRNITFKPGINLILGANGSGKTSIIKAIQSYMTYSSDFWSEKQHLDLISHYHIRTKETYNVDIKGKICKYINYKPQELSEVRDLDYNTQCDFATRVLSNFQSKGEGRRCYHDSFVDFVQHNSRFTKEEVETLKENISVDHIDIKTLLVTSDEPENSMAINMQFGLFDWFCEFAEAWGNNLQLIIASHSVAAFKLAEKNLPYVNVIELNKNWVKNINKRILE